MVVVIAASLSAPILNCFPIILKKITENKNIQGITVNDVSVSLLFDCLIKKTVYIIKNTELTVSII